MDEYQKQLDAVEGTLRKEAKHIERTIAERAVKQIELINQKYVIRVAFIFNVKFRQIIISIEKWSNYRNEQEFELLEEKHREEMELAKIRLENATKTIVQLEEELSVYRAKRYVSWVINRSLKHKNPEFLRFIIFAQNLTHFVYVFFFCCFFNNLYLSRSDIADRLHKVIETQWQKTLEIIASDASADSNQPPANNNCNPRKNNDLFNVIEHEINRRNSFSKCDNVNIHTAQHNKTKKHLNNSIDWRNDCDQCNK